MTLQRLCRGCGCILDATTDFAAHVFPKALGGRLKPKGIICRTCNTALDRASDNALVRAFGDWPTLLNFPRDGGGHPAKTVDTRKGRRVRLEPSGKLTSADVVYDVQPIEGGDKLEISAGDWKTFRQLLKRAGKRFPQMDAAEAEKHARMLSHSDGDELKVTLDYSPKAVFGGVVTAIWLYLIHTTGRSFMEWPRLLDCVADMQRYGGTFRYLVDGLPGLSGPDIPLRHKIVIRSVPRTGELVAYVEVLGVMKVGGVFASAPPPAFFVEEVYAFDIAGQADRSAEFSIDAARFERQDWRTVGLGPTDAEKLRLHFAGALEALAALYYARSADT